jgi:DNA-binding NarL/FixJ family response regulator
MSEGRISVYLVDANVAFRNRLQHWLLAKPDIDIIGSVSRPSELPALLDADLVVVDLAFAGENTLRWLEGYVTRYEGANVLVLSNDPEDSYAQRVLNAGARGYLMKTATPARLLAAIRKAAAGRFVVSPRMASRLYRGGTNRSEAQHRYSEQEFEAWKLSKQGYSNAAVAAELNISVGEVVLLKRCIATKLTLHLRRDTLSLRSPGAVCLDTAV